MENDSDELWERSLIDAASDSMYSDTSANHVDQETIARFASQSRAMSSRDIANFIDVTAQMHKCEISDISYGYEPIIYDDGQVALDEINIIFRMKALIDNVVITRVIHTIRVAVPRETQQRARTMKEEYYRTRETTPVAQEPVVQHTAPKSHRARRGRHRVIS